MKGYNISGIPVVEGGQRTGQQLVGYLTNRDVRFATDARQKVSELMTKERLDHGARGRRIRTRPSASCTSTGLRSCWWSTRSIAASG